MTEFFKAVGQVLEFVIGSSTAATLTAVGLILILLCGYLTYLVLGRKPDETSNSIRAILYLCLIGGLVFSAAGPSVALYNELSSTAQQTIQIKSVDEIRQRLVDNARVRYVVRLIAYKRSDDREEQLSIDRVRKLGPEKQLYSFVGDYEELKGRSVAEAIDMIGIGKDYDRVTAIIFPLPRRSGDTSNFYPANARGLLQVIRLAEQKIGPNDRFIKPETFNNRELADLRETDLNTYPIKAHEQLYRGYCQVARAYFCSIQPSRELIGGLFRDWHPLGFSQRDPPDRPCSIPEEQFCAFPGWEGVRTNFQNHFGGRAFLIENLDVRSIEGRIMIDFTDPQNQKIPEIALLPPRR